jgi:DNA-binding NarL/FixJ family response regulator
LHMKGEPINAMIMARAKDPAIEKKTKDIFKFLEEHTKPRDFKILSMIAEGYTQSEIGLELGITESRVCQIIQSFRNSKNLRGLLEGDMFI